MEKSIPLLWIILSIGNLTAKKSLAPVETQVVNPQSITQQELEQHKKIGSLTYFQRDCTTLPNVDKGKYDDWFEVAYKNFRREDNDFLISAYNFQKMLVGGLYCKVLEGPNAALKLQKKEKAYYIYLLYVDSCFRRQGIAMALLEHLSILATKSSIPIFVYTYAINTPAQNLYEKCAFTLLIDEKHLDGKWSDAAQALVGDEECLIAPLAYRKN